jgi:hypothetical protein
VRSETPEPVNQTRAPHRVQAVHKSTCAHRPRIESIHQNNAADADHMTHRSQWITPAALEKAPNPAWLGKCRRNRIALLQKAKH